MKAAAISPDILQEDRLRADLYNYLGLMLSAPPDQVLLDQTMGLSGDQSELGLAIGGLSRVAKIVNKSLSSWGCELRLRSGLLAPFGSATDLPMPRRIAHRPACGESGEAREG